jgi:hypothetical protein
MFLNYHHNCQVVLDRFCSFLVVCYFESESIWIHVYAYPGSFYKDDDARLGQSAPVGVSGISSVRTQPTSSFAGGRSVLGTGGGVSGLGSSLGSYSTSNTNTQRSVGGVLGNTGVTGQNTGVYDRARGRSPYRWIERRTRPFFDPVDLYMLIDGHVSDWKIAFWFLEIDDDHDKCYVYVSIFSISIVHSFYFCFLLVLYLFLVLCLIVRCWC